MWPSTFGFAATVLVGVLLASILRTRPTEAALAMTWRNVMTAAPPLERQT